MYCNLLCHVLLILIEDLPFLNGDEEKRLGVGKGNGGEGLEEEGGGGFSQDVK